VAEKFSRILYIETMQKCYILMPKQKNVKIKTKTHKYLIFKSFNLLDGLPKFKLEILEIFFFLSFSLIGPTHLLHSAIFSRARHTPESLSPNIAAVVN